MNKNINSAKASGKFFGTILLLFTIGFLAVWRYAIHHQDAGIALFTQEKYAEAEGHFRRVISVRPDNGDSHFFLGMILYRQKRYEESIQELKVASLYEPTYRPIQLETANALYATGKHSKARKIWSELLAPSNDDVAKEARKQLETLKD